MKTIHLFSFFILLGLFSCKSQPQKVVVSAAPDEKVEVIEKVPQRDACREILEGEMPESDGVMGFKTILKDKCMILNLTYSGGCQEHDFELYWNGAWAESIPPQTHLYLYHNAKGDNCRELSTGKVAFDMEKMTYPGLNTVQMTIHSGELDPVIVTYTYE